MVLVAVMAETGIVATRANKVTQEERVNLATPDSRVERELMASQAPRDLTDEAALTAKRVNVEITAMLDKMETLVDPGWTA